MKGLYVCHGVQITLVFRVIGQDLECSPEIQAFLPELYRQWPGQSKPGGVPDSPKHCSETFSTYCYTIRKEIIYRTVCCVSREPKERGTQSKVRGRIYNCPHIHLGVLFILQLRYVFRGI